jgi:hypothetical protein
MMVLIYLTLIVNYVGYNNIVLVSYSNFLVCIFLGFFFFFFLELLVLEEISCGLVW